ncbi:hypothetical protein GGQ73_003026 [Rhizobium skierniewicense]|uniref:DUF2971 domain-containing protein n=1 Tax=Rhizobium skierniewicense TaxID=984260 RepID=A0A7W6G2Q3_9HYPH|nr:DUF2971 domain-containing protein [Rhizobium skierniewicense]MBB3947062.1 hypothetical protein [Rhizobium skierniewicense]
MSPSDLPPDYLSHYTKLDVLESILDNGLRASNVLYLNDGSELKFAIDIARSVLRDLVQNRPSSHYIYDSDIEDGLADDRLPSIFATSFCTDDDLLSQWRAYGGISQGISISLHSQPLADIFKKLYGSPTRISYKENEARAKLYGLLSLSLIDWDEVLGSPGLTPAEIAAGVILEQAPRYKHPGFAEENEWRFFITRPSQQMNDVEFFTRGGLLVPFLPVCADKLPISHITIGPGPQQRLNKQSVENLLRRKNYLNVEVRVSEVPYRT